MTQDVRFLEKRGKSPGMWRMVVPVPRAAQAALGKKRYQIALRTDSLKEARRQRNLQLPDIQRQIAQALKPVADTLIRDALRWRDAVHPEKGLLMTVKAEQIDEDEPDGESDVGGPLGKRAGLFLDIASGAATPIDHFVDDWIAAAKMKARQEIDYRRAISKLTTWLESKGHDGTVESVTERVAADYVHETFEKAGVHPRTANKDVTALGGFWRYIKRRGYAQSIPWHGQAMSEKGSAIEKRPYADKEVMSLLTGKAIVDDVEIKVDAGEMLSDAIRILLLSGMRAGELAMMSVERALDGIFRIRDAKTPSGNRDVPIHSALTEIIERRCEGKQSGDFLFSDIPTPRVGSASERSQALTKKFGRYREKLGIGTVKEGARQSDVDLHSCRRWFAMKGRDAIEAGVTNFGPWTLADVLGHSRQSLPLGLTLGGYAGPSKEEARRACVEAIRLPKNGELYDH